MTLDLPHDEAAEQLSDAALDALPPDEQAAVLAHAATCAQCGPALAAFRDAVTQLAYVVPQMADDPVRRSRVRTRLLARARADLSVSDGSDSGASGQGGDAPLGVGRTSVGARTVVSAGGRQDVGRSPWLASPAVGWGLALAAGIVGVLAVNRRSTMDDERLVRERAVLTARIDALRDSIAARDAFVSAVTGKQVSSMQLTSGTVRAPWAWMFWDHATNRWTLVARDLAPVPPGRTYQLWLVTPHAKISAGTFDPKPDGSAEVEATYALAPDSLRAIAVTEEPAGGVRQPTGPFVITATTGNRPGQ